MQPQAWAYLTDSSSHMPHDAIQALRDKAFDLGAFTYLKCLELLMDFFLNDNYRVSIRVVLELLFLLEFREQRLHPGHSLSHILLRSPQLSILPLKLLSGLVRSLMRCPQMSELFLVLM